MFDLIFSSQSRNFLKNVEEISWDRIVKKIEGLRINPFPQDVKRVINQKDKVFRVRVGDYRILYVLIKNENKLFISKIEKRSKAYD